MNLQNKNLTILITGAEGFIGSHLTEELVRQGYKVRAFVLYNSFNSWGWLDQCAEDVKGNFEIFLGDGGSSGLCGENLFSSGVRGKRYFDATLGFHFEASYS